MAVKIGGDYYLWPTEALRLQNALRKTREMIGNVTRSQVRNMYLESRYKVPNPDKIPDRGMTSSAPQVSVAPVSEFAPFGGRQI